jgi:hypothetical protein
LFCKVQFASSKIKNIIIIIIININKQQHKNPSSHIISEDLSRRRHQHNSIRCFFRFLQVGLKRRKKNTGTNQGGNKEKKQ